MFIYFQVNPGVAMEFTKKELYAIEEIQGEENLFRLLVQSLCPSIYGHEMVKAGACYWVNFLLLCIPNRNLIWIW